MANEKQKDEISALESIYTKEEFSYYEEKNLHHCNMKVFINLPNDYYVTYKDTRNPEETDVKITISYLPPLLLFITLPEDYPSTSPPNFRLSSSWLPHFSVTRLCKQLDNLWKENEGQEILFLWIAFLQDETLEYLNIASYLKMDYAYTLYKIKQFYRSMDMKAIEERLYARNPVQMLVEYNAERKQIEFLKNFYVCKICFCDKSGQNCTRFFPCQHIFCKECIAGYLEVRIKEGNVQNICCPEEKCTSEAMPQQIKDLVNPDLFAKYDSILLAATLDTMSDIVYCPRRNCQYPVSREPDEQMATCPACEYAFCIYCKMVYHGIQPCKTNSANKQQLVNEYQTASRERKLELEQRYGKKKLQVLVEDTMSENWIKDNSHECPQCHAAIEKSDGCNKMTCWKCKTYFCWLCGARLNQEKPYLHFQTPSSKCFNMLYHGMISDDEDDENDMIPGVYMGLDSDDDDEGLHEPYY